MEARHERTHAAGIAHGKAYAELGACLRHGSSITPKQGEALRGADCSSDTRPTCHW